MKEDEAKLKSIASDIYKADEYTSNLAERSEQAAAKTSGGQDGLSWNERRAESGSTVGRTEPDQSKEHNTEVAVEAGREGLHSEDKP
jgi:hypothetical protein